MVRSRDLRRPTERQKDHPPIFGHSEGRPSRLLWIPETDQPFDSPEPYGQLFGEPDDAFRSIDLGPLGFHNEYRFRPVTEKMRRNIESLYDGEICYTYESLIKPLIEKLHALHLYDQTMIILTSGHGEEFFEPNSWMHTHSLYNEVIKVPLIIKFFQSRHAGQKMHGMARSIDIMPTILEEVGRPYPKKDFDGQSLLGLLKVFGRRP